MASGYSANHLEAFVDAARRGSFSAVARRRGMKASSIARQVNALEQELGVALFIRTTRSLVLTEAGRRLFDRSEHILAELAEAKSEATSLRSEVRGTLRIGCWPTFGRKHILPHLPDLMERYPRLQIDLNLSERLHDPLLDRMDLVFRIGELADSTLVATRLASQRSYFAASSAYIRRHGAPQSLADCRSHRLIDKRQAASCMGWRTLLGESREMLKAYVLQTDDLQLQADACAAGLGIAHLPDWVLYDHVERGAVTLLALQTSAAAASTGIYLLRNGGPPTAAIEAFSSHIRARLGSPPVWERVRASSIDPPAGAKRLPARAKPSRSR
jgi:DNA-binding transcriptional LysR family regulator